jgi:class 3 adenylate cyclase
VRPPKNADDLKYNRPRLLFCTAFAVPFWFAAAANRQGEVVSTIADWLRSLGMSEYAQRFAENDIDIAVLPELTDQHLKDLGVSLGRRLKMMRAIREIGGDTSVTAQPPVVTGQKPQDAAERRQLTVMFVDLVGSTALSARLDPEEFLKRTVVGFQWVSRNTVHLTDFLP